MTAPHGENATTRRTRKIDGHNMFFREQRQKGKTSGEVAALWKALSDEQIASYRRNAAKWNDDARHGINPRDSLSWKRKQNIEWEKVNKTQLDNRASKRQEAIARDASHIDPIYVSSLDAETMRRLSWF